MPPTGGTLVYATEDQAVADANPSFTWLVLDPVEAEPTPDTIAPSVPTGLAATPGDGQVSLSWTASTDAVGVTGYRVYRDGVLATSPTGTSSIVSSLTNGTSYAFTVAAIDAAGNLSAQTAAVNATPVASSDVTDPTAPTLSATDGDGQSVLTWTAATDNTAVTGYKVYKDAVLLATLGNVLTYTATGLTNGTPVAFTVTALDAAGNESVPSNTDTVTPVAAGGGAGTVLASSDFTKADGAGLPDTAQGQTFTTEATAANSPSTLGTISNTARVNTGGHASTHTGVPCGQANVRVSVKLANVGTAAGIMLRKVDKDSFWRVTVTPTTVGLSKYVAGTFSAPAVTTGSTTTTVAAADVIAVEASGSTFTCKKNGTTIWTFTGATDFQTATVHGMHFGADTSGRLDDFLVEAL